MSKDGGKGFAQMAQMLGGGGGGGGMDRAEGPGRRQDARSPAKQIEEMAAKLQAAARRRRNSRRLGGLPPGFNPFKK